MARYWWAALICAPLWLGTAALAQESGVSDAEIESATEDFADDVVDADVSDDLLSEDALETLVSPIALYPDPLLVQVLVASTYPIEVIKADRYLSDNEELSTDDLKEGIEAEDWDESVAVLATAFPEVLIDMATHIEWTETMGTAMLAQSDDVMDAVQVMRQAATDTGALQDSEQQDVEVTQAEDGNQTIIIQPADPEVVYVPQYDTQAVYDTSNNFGVGDAVAAGVITYAGISIIDEIFDDDDDWYDYWGCRNCAGWGGAPMYHRPDVTKKVNREKNINIDNSVNIEGNNVAWKPDNKRKEDAQNKIKKKKKKHNNGKGGQAKLPVTKPDRGDEMRNRLSKQTNTRDISKDKRPQAQVQRPKSPSKDKRDAAVKRTGKGGSKAVPASAKRPSTADLNKSLQNTSAKSPKKAKAPSKPKKAKKPSKPTKASAPARKPSAHNKGAALHKKAPAKRTKAASKRGKSAKKKVKKKR